jgi:CobQ-like glutamine amidotransferase family enzyme
LHGLLRELPTEVNKVPRISKFEVAEFADSQVVGYKNTDLALPTIERFGNLIGTVLHGPLLAKNAKLSDDILGAMLRNGRSTNFELTATLKKYEDDARSLAIELSSE